MTDAEMTKMMEELEGESTGKSEVAPSAAVPMETSKTPAAPAAAPVSEKVKVSAESSLSRFFDPDQARKDLSFNPNDLDTAMMEHASLYSHYAIHAVNARRQFDRLKGAIEILEARLDGEIRIAALAEGKKITEAGIKSQMVADKRWSGAQSKVIEAGAIYRACEVMESAMCHRKDMILEVARNQRKERDGNLRVLENQDMRDRVLGSLAEKRAA